MNEQELIFHQEAGHLFELHFIAGALNWINDAGLLPDVLSQRKKRMEAFYIRRKEEIEQRLKTLDALVCDSALDALGLWHRLYGAVCVKETLSHVARRAERRGACSGERQLWLWSDDFIGKGCGLDPTESFDGLINPDVFRKNVPPVQTGHYRHSDLIIASAAPGRSGGMFIDVFELTKTAHLDVSLYRERTGAHTQQGWDRLIRQSMLVKSRMGAFASFNEMVDNQVNALFGQQAELESMLSSLSGWLSASDIALSESAAQSQFGAGKGLYKLFQGAGYITTFFHDLAESGLIELGGFGKLRFCVHVPTTIDYDRFCLDIIGKRRVEDFIRDLGCDEDCDNADVFAWRMLERFGRERKQLEEGKKASHMSASDRMRVSADTIRRRFRRSGIIPGQWVDALVDQAERAVSGQGADILLDVHGGKDKRAMKSGRIPFISHEEDPLTAGWVDGDYISPADLADRDWLLDFVKEHAQLAFEDERKEWFFERMRSHMPEKCTIRDVHSAAILAAMEMPDLRYRCLMLEGAPGMGKTTTVVDRYLAETDEKVLFIYMSPRVMVNSNVFDAASQVGVALETNRDLIDRAVNLSDKHESKVVALKGAGEPLKRLFRRPPKNNSSCANAPDDHVVIIGSTDLYLFKKEMSDDPGALYGVRSQTQRVAEHVSQTHRDQRKSVMASFEGGMNTLALVNVKTDKLTIVLTIQAVRELLRRNDSPHAFYEQLDRYLLQPASGLCDYDRIIVMIDEITGDEAGVFIARKLNDAFLTKTSGPPATLIVADASVSSDKAMAHLMFSSGDMFRKGLPGTMVISTLPGDERAPFVAVSNRVSPHDGKKGDIFFTHVMSNMFPASKLGIRYHLAFLPPSTPRTRALAGGGARLEGIIRDMEVGYHTERIVELIRGDKLNSPALQVGAFIQNKNLLTRIREKLIGLEIETGAGEMVRLDDENICVVHADVTARDKKRIIDNAEKWKVVLMTSSATRGLTFPMMDRLYAHIPSFNVESGLMEIMQFIYRGRGRLSKGGSLDGGERMVVFSVLDRISGEFDSQQEFERFIASSIRQRVLNIITLFTMIRTALASRIAGAVRVRKGRSRHAYVSFVPLGPVRLGDQQLSAASKIKALSWLKTSMTLDNQGGAVKILDSALDLLESAGAGWVRWMDVDDGRPALTQPFISVERSDLARREILVQPFKTDALWRSGSASALRCKMRMQGPLLLERVTDAARIADTPVHLSVDAGEETLREMARLLAGVRKNVQKRKMKERYVNALTWLIELFEHAADNGTSRHEMRDGKPTSHAWLVCCAPSLHTGLCQAHGQGFKTDAGTTELFHGAVRQIAPSWPAAPLDRRFVSIPFALGMGVTPDESGAPIHSSSLINFTVLMLSV